VKGKFEFHEFVTRKDPGWLLKQTAQGKPLKSGLKILAGIFDNGYERIWSIWAGGGKLENLKEFYFMQGRNNNTVTKREITQPARTKRKKKGP